MINVTIGDQTKKFMRILQIDFYPFTKSEVKQHFRKIIKSCHSDRNEGDDTFTKIVIEAYTHIRNLAISDNGIAKKASEILNAERQNTNIFELYDNCKKCKGTGKIKNIVNSHIEDCDRCSVRLRPGIFGFSTYISTGKIKIACNACHSSGKFKQRSGKTVDCFKCNGKGFRYIKCFKCKGTKVIHIKAYTTEHTCINCSGTGRVKVDPFNPVITKGAIL